MKFITINYLGDSIEFVYENNITQRIWPDQEIRWYKNLDWHKEDGARIKNCIMCKIDDCYLKNRNNKYKRHFCMYNEYMLSKEFAEKTKHIICKFCNDFCKQECFI